MDSYEKKYKEIVGKIRKAYLCAITDSTKAVLEEILPELVESKDEKIKKEIISFLEDIGLKELKRIPRNIGEWFAWLEKQGEQKPNDKVKSKFKIGDWIIENGVNRNPVQITSFEEAKGLGIKVWFNNGTGTFIDFLEGYHKWTIQDAKDGDVLATDDGNICVFDGTVEDGKYPFAYYGLTRYRFESYDRRLPFTHDNVHPATKEQHDLLFAKVKEAGYEWDAEKKELTKIAPKPTVIIPKFRIGDNIKTTNEEPLTITKIDEKGYWSEELFICNFDNADKWELVEQKPAWSEEDEKIFKMIISNLENLRWSEEMREKYSYVPSTSTDYYQTLIEWLKSLKDRYIYEANNE